MNTDASNVEDINIPQIIERLSMSCIASSGPTSFAIDHSPCARMTVSQRKVRFCGGVRVPVIVVDVCGSPRSCFQHFTRFPLLRRPLVVIVPF